MKALVTGGTKGIGLAIAKELSNEEIVVTVCSRTLPRNLWPGLRWLQYDALEAFGVGFKKLLPKIEDSDILVNNLGGGGTWGKDDVTKTRPHVWRQVYQKNAGSAIQFTMACLPHMIEKGWGRVVTITSLGNDRPWFNMAKTAETSLMLTLAQRKELVRRNITFNCVAPGRIAVGKESDVTPEYLESLPMGRLGTPEEVAAVVAFLCSDAASLVNGAVIKCGDVP